MNTFFQQMWRGISGATLFTFVLGFVWFHPAIFGTIWATAAGVEPATPLFAVILTLLANFAASMGIAWFMFSAGTGNMGDGLRMGLLAAIFFVLPAIIGQWIFMDKIQLFAVNMGYNLVSLMGAGIIIGALRARNSHVPA